MKIISIIGSGNVGLRIGKHFLDSTYVDVIFNDISKDVVQKLSNMGYDATTDMKYTLERSDMSFVAVPTPIADSGLYNTSFLEGVFISIGNVLRDKKDRHIFVLKSTVTPGTTEDLIIPIIEKHSGKTVGKDFGVVYNPEFLTVISDTWTKDKNFCVNSDNEGRIVLGEGQNNDAGDIVEAFYRGLDQNTHVLRTDYKTAEMTKLVANNRLALAISFSNEIFLSCEEMKEKGIDIDVDFIIKSVSIDKRVGRYGSIFGQAFGGPCFLKDTVALETFIKNKTGRCPDLISGSVKINNEMKEKYGIRE